MAKATKINPTKVPILLELSPDEAQTLVDILMHIGGDPVLSRRKYANAIRAALNSVQYYGQADSDTCSDESVNFRSL